MRSIPPARKERDAQDGKRGKGKGERERRTGGHGCGRPYPRFDATFLLHRRIFPPSHPRILPSSPHLPPSPIPAGPPNSKHQVHSNRIDCDRLTIDCDRLTIDSKTSTSPRMGRPRDFRLHGFTELVLLLQGMEHRDVCYGLLDRHARGCHRLQRRLGYAGH